MTIYPNHFPNLDKQFIQKCLDCKDLDQEWKGYILDNMKKERDKGEGEKHGISYFVLLTPLLLLYILYILYSLYF